MNRLAQEKSPYLLQHAHNPVDWYPWGPEAFERARLENKPILLSIGYATCHWCHVMERESFENPATAALMNQYFVCIKLDREERPDVDKIYMTAVSAMTGSGGWPLNVFLTPELRPFLGGTYFPPEDRWGRIGWPRLIERLGTAWRDPLERARLTAAGDKMVSALETYLTGSPAPGSFTEEHLQEGVAAFAEEFDAERGGFGRAPKFPMPVNQTFLLEAHRYVHRTGADAPWGEKARDMALTTLRAMARGGLFDVLGGGFHRYATDERWHLPHFEKMLYDNAPLAVNYLDAFALTGDPALADTARATLDYLRRDLRHPKGGFYSAEDADSLPPGSSVKAEGAFYVWTQDEIDQALGAEAAFFSEAQGVRPEGNVAEDPHGEFLEKNVLFLPPSGDGKDTSTERAARLAAARRKLFDIRSRRPRPFLDDKILTGWNGLALSAFARGYGVLGDDVYLDIAREAARFLKNNLWAGKEGHRRWREGEAALPALATDHAFLAQGLVDLHQVCFDPALLEWAESILETFLKTFVDDQGGVRQAPLGGDRIVAALEREDNVEPSAASVAAGALARVSALLDRPDFLTAAEKILGALAGPAREHPRMFANALAVGAALLGGPRHVLLVGAGDRPATQEFLRILRRHVTTSLTVFWVDSPETHARWAPRLWPVRQAPWSPDATRAYLCENRACRPPTEDPRVLERTLQNC